MADWTFHELALAVGYRSLGEDAGAVALLLGRSTTEIKTLFITLDVLDSDKSEPVKSKGAPDYLRKRRLPVSLVQKFTTDQPSPIPGEPPQGQSALAKLKLKTGNTA